MKKNKLFVLGMAAIALTFIVGLAGCSKKEAGAAASAVGGAANVAANVLKSLPKGAITASKPEDFKYDLTADGNGIVIQGILVKDPVAVIVPAEIEGYPVVEIGEDAFIQGGSRLSIITLPDTITKLGKDAFNQTGITEFIFPPKVTEIPNSCFYDTALTSVIIPEGITKIGNNAFSYSRSLVEVTIPESVTTIDHDAFVNCSELAKVNLPSHSIEYNNEYGGVFVGCPKLSLAARKAITDSGYTGEF